ncbi:amino acid permease [Nitrospirillum sp. BR 11164]|uniref:APC family permease n=1 Tax=Nitrospirillum sp. BR 11164 TaxID=3104324 RepID=UPI002AFE003A|nr:amino acid permease [Nitrospirillum sp. BR 11164]MEA1648341.1 amino acid permease [Nitrospirillum sp. BR 11164]
MGLWTVKPVDALIAAGEGKQGVAKLTRGLGTLDLILAGVGCTVGAGIFVMTGSQAATHAGPAVALSFAFAALACLFAGLCFAELATVIPVAGSAYSYTYATLGEIVAWLVGWNLVLEYMISGSAVAVGFSGYLNAFLGQWGVHLPTNLASAPLSYSDEKGFEWTGAFINGPAVFIIALCGVVLSLGIKETARFNNISVAIKVGAMVLFAVVGIFYVDTANWHPFIPESTGDGAFGWSGVFRAAGTLFFAYIGFDAVSTAAQEARSPQRTVPRGILGGLAVCVTLYVVVGMVMTGLAPYTMLDAPEAIFIAIKNAGPSLAWLGMIINLAAILGLGSAILICNYGQIRIFYAMARDGLMPPSFASVNPEHHVPWQATLWVTLVAAIIGGIAPLDVLGDLVSLGTLMAFALVCVATLVLRVRDPHRPRPFRVPYLPVVAVTGAVICVALMISLGLSNWIRFGAWSLLGLAIYFAYGMRNSARQREAQLAE